MKKLVLALAMAASTLGACTTADAQYRSYDGYHYRPYYNGYHNRYYRYNRPYYRNHRYYCRRSDGTTGTILGAVGGALVGRAVDTHGDRLPGTVIGGAAGALAGRSIERGNCR